MKPGPAMPWALSLLDDGLRLYRRHLTGFLMVASALFVPVAIIALLFNTFVQTQLGSSWTFAGLLVLALLLYPLFLYAFVALSRTTAMILDQQPISLRAALRFGPLRALGMGCYSVFFIAIAHVVAGSVYAAITCPILYAISFGTAFIGAVGGSGVLGAAGLAFTVIFLFMLVLALVTYTATLASQAYTVQAFALEQRPFGSSVGRSVDLLTFRFGRNLLVFLGAGTIVGTLMLAYAGTLLIGGNALFGFLQIELSTAARSALSTAVLTASFVLLVPPLPIWMALLHRRLAGERDARELQVEVEQWHAAATAAGPA